MGLHVRKRGDWIGGCPQCGKAYPGWPTCKFDGFPLDGREWRQGRRRIRWGETQVTINVAQGQVGETMMMRTRDRLRLKLAGLLGGLVMTLTGTGGLVSPQTLDELECLRAQKTSQQLLATASDGRHRRTCPIPSTGGGLDSGARRGFSRLVYGTGAMERVT